jgi:hypothetical protein
LAPTFDLKIHCFSASHVSGAASASGKLQAARAGSLVRRLAIPRPRRRSSRRCGRFPDAWREPWPGDALVEAREVKKASIVRRYGSVIAKVADRRSH